MPKTRSKSNRLEFLSPFGLGITPASFAEEDQENGVLIKEALLMIEGDHYDSQKRPHKFSRERLLDLVKNTNVFLRSGGRIPWQKDHDKTQSANIGDLEGELEVRIITEEDLPNPRLKKLVGRLGAFGQLVAKGDDVVAQVMSGRIKTLSPGIDVSTNTIKEISATPQPAIMGLSVFKQHESAANFALTWDDADSAQMEIDELKEEYAEITEKFWEIATAISQADESVLMGEDPAALLEDAIGVLSERIAGLLGLIPDDMEPEEMDAGVQGIKDPNYVKRQQNLASAQMNTNAGKLASFAQALKRASKRRR